jgi:hypothetical protein
MKQFLLNRLGEPSTWRGLTLCATAFGMNFNPDQAYAIASLGMALAGGIGVMAPDQLRK